MIYLSRLIINPHNRNVRRDLNDCYNMHRTLLSAFPQAPDQQAAREHFGLLFRVEEHTNRLMRILVQSQHQPDWGQLPAGYLADSHDANENPSLRPLDQVYQQIQVGQQLRFRLRANPSKRVSAKSDQDPKWHGKRIELRDEQQQIEWLQRKAEQGGFRLLATQTSADVLMVQASKQAKSNGWQRNNHLRFGTVVFDGQLEVSDSQQFLQTLNQGIGSGKAFGFGLLSIAAV